MADPFSISASAAGLMSLAITVCQSLGTYYASWKSYQTDIDRLCRDSEIVSNNMRHLKTSLDSREFPAALKQQVESSIEACAGDIRALEAEVTLIKGTKLTEGQQEKIKFFLRRTRYPFKESTLKKLKDSVLCLQAGVEFAVGILGIDSLGALNASAMAVAIDLGDAKRDIHTISQGLPSIQKSIDRIDQGLPLISSNVVSIGANVREIRDDLHQVRDHLQRSEKRLAFLPFMQQRIEALPSSFASSILPELESHGLVQHQFQLNGFGSAEIIDRIDALSQETRKLQLHCIRKPGPLRDELDHFDDGCFITPDRRPRHAEKVAETFHLAKFCTCRSVVTSTGTWSIWKIVQIVAKATKTHRRNCPLSRGSQQNQTQAVCIRTFYAGKLLSKALEVSFGLTYGAGGYSMSSSLQLRTLLREDSPVFQLFDERIWRSKNNGGEMEAREFLDYMKESLQGLRMMFGQGVASPKDINGRGKTILQLAIDRLCESKFKRSSDSRVLAGRKDFILGIVHLGVPLDHTDFNNGHAVNDVLFLERGGLAIEPQWQTYPILSSISPVVPWWTTPLRIFSAARDVDEYVEFYNCGILSSAVLARSKESVGRILWKFPDAVNERNSLGQTPLHLSADWSCGTTRLLAAGARVDIGDRDNVYPLYYACNANCLRTVQALIAADSPIDLGIQPLGRLERRRFRKGWGVLPPEIFDQVCAGLSDRRRRLAELARRVLPNAKYKELLRNNVDLFDSMAAEAYRKIVKKGFRVPSALRVSDNRTSVYHTHSLSSEEMQKLYEAGFREIDALRHRAGGPWGHIQMTPLMTAVENLDASADLRPLEWLISKGANLLKEVTTFGAFPIHWLAATLTCLHVMNSIDNFQPTLRLPQEAYLDLRSSFQLISKGSNLMATDRCRCGCVLNGCSSINFLLKHMFGLAGDTLKSRNRHRWRFEAAPKTFMQWNLEDFCFFANWIVETAYGHREILESTYNEVVRLFLFWELELTHTCCTSGFNRSSRYGWTIWKLKSWEEVCEIRDEERELLLDLDNLCSEASTRRKLYDGPFNEFLQAFLHEVRERPRTKIGEEDIKNIEEIGVVLDYDTLGR